MQINKHHKQSVVLLVCFFMFILGLNLIPVNTFSQELAINDLGYFETTGVNVLVFTNEYNGFFFDEKTAGIELIHHGVRTATGGAVRMQNTPEQWDLIPTVMDRKVDKENNTINVLLRYKDLDFDFRLVVTAKDKGVLINVYLDNPVPKKLEGYAGLNMEFLPASYFGHTFMMDGNPGIFPRYPSSDTRIEPVSKKLPQFEGHTTFDDRGRGEFIVPYPLATGKTLVMAPEDPERFVTIKSMDDADLMLFDGRNVAQNGWFIVRGILPVNKTGNVLTWYLEPNSVANWTRKPNIGFSQVGYIPDQDKVSVIELDPNDTPLQTASLFQVTPEGKKVEVFKGDVQVWGKYLRYNYAKFDFSSVKEPGVYFIQYGDQKTNTFPINGNVYDNVWHPTWDVWVPEQMDHVEVNEAYRVWHGAPFLDDALQAPVNVQYYDGYSMGPETNTKYKPFERIPGLAVGGWFDAGDFDIQSGTINSVTSGFVDIWEEFDVDRDETFVDQKTRYVDIHRPDGKPDALQQIEHGASNLVAQCENIGFPARGIVVPNLHQYHHLGDASTETDNLPYNPNLKPYESDGKSSGTLDDRLAFTTRTSYLDYQTVAALAAANRALKGFNDDLADRSLASALKLFDEADEIVKKGENDTSPFSRWFRGADIDAVLQLYITTKDEKYADRFKSKIWSMLDMPTDGPQFGQMFFLGRLLNPALKAIPYMDDAYKTKLKDFVVKYKAAIDEFEKENPYGVPISPGGWGGSGSVVNWAITNYYVQKSFPDVLGTEYVLRGLDYVFGCHPYSNISFVNAVGVRSKKVAYGNNRADFTTIAGGIVPGVMLLKPDFLENKDDWPFLWGENEVVIAGCVEYIFLANAANELINK